jgi:hypothetical protein
LVFVQSDLVEHLLLILDLLQAADSFTIVILKLIFKAGVEVVHDLALSSLLVFDVLRYITRCKTVTA